MHFAIAVTFSVVLPLAMAAAAWERDALRDPWRYALLAAALAGVWIAARWSTRGARALQAEAVVFDEEPADRVLTLDLWDVRHPARPSADSAGPEV